MSDNGGTTEDLDRRVLRVGDADVTLTLDDAKAIEVALLDYLKQSDYEFREKLIRMTSSARIDAQGKMWIGPWLVGADRGVIYARYVERPSPRSAFAHRASLRKQDGAWTVMKVLTEHITLRR
jgi:hypothetical protein